MSRAPNILAAVYHSVIPLPSKGADMTGLVIEITERAILLTARGIAAIGRR
jgi:hypothetical protein